MRSPRSEFIAGVRAELPILLGVTPFGMIYGVLAMGAGLPVGAAMAMSSIVFAGSAQFVGAQLIRSGTPGMVIVLTTFIVNLRHMLYSASIAPHLAHLSRRWKWLLAYLLTDEAYAVTITRYNQAADSANKHWYLLGAGLALWSTWQVSTAVGIFLGAQFHPVGRSILRWRSLLSRSSCRCCATGPAWRRRFRLASSQCWPPTCPTNWD